MANVVIYTKNYCPFSKDLKTFLEEKNVEFTELMIQDDDNLRREMEEKSGGRKDTPQVFINSSHIGSFDDLKALESIGKLEELLK